VLFNHRLPKMLHHEWGLENGSAWGSSPAEPYSTSTPIANKASVDVAAGSEMFFAYCGGDLKWFKDRDIPISPFTVGEAGASEEGSDAAYVPVDELRRTGHCVTQVRIAPSSLPPTVVPVPADTADEEEGGGGGGSVYTVTVSAGLGLFAARSFNAGEVVTVSPVMLLPRAAVEKTAASASVLANYCFAADDVNTVLLPFGPAAIANHAPPSSPPEGPPSSSTPLSSSSPAANMQMQWFFWDEHEQPPSGQVDSHGHGHGPGHGARAIKLASTVPVEELAAKPWAPLDVAYVATRDIAAGEELFVDYDGGQRRAPWTTAWAAYLQALQAWAVAPGADEEERPAFRAFVTLPPGLVPPHWYNGYGQEEAAEAAGAGAGQCAADASTCGPAAASATEHSNASSAAAEGAGGGGDSGVVQGLGQLVWSAAEVMRDAVASLAAV